MQVNIDDLSTKAKAFAQHCMDNYSLKDLAHMVYSEKKIEQCDRFDISEQQWNEAVYLAIKQMGKN